MDLDALVAQAAVILDEASKPFIAGHRADSAVQKKGNDFATEVDLAIERQVVEALESATGIGVHGEEFGGADLDAPLVWVLDPIDGTFNYAAGSPMAAILLGLLRDGEPVAGLTWLPFTDQRYTAVLGGPLYANGVAQPPIGRGDIAQCVIGIGTFNVDWRGRFPGRYRLAVLEELSRVCSKMRMHGATGIDIAYVGAGILGGAISFGHHIWDHAAGVALVRGAGGSSPIWRVPNGRRRRCRLSRPRPAYTSTSGDSGARRIPGGLSLMDVAVRVIPCLDVDDGRVVKGVNFENLRDAGDPVELAAAYDAEGADELCFLDVTASSSGRATMLDVVRRTAEQVFIPLTVGGGVRSVPTWTRCCAPVPTKVSVNTAAIARPELLAELSRQFGSQCIVLSVDARTVPAGSAPTPSGWEVTTHGGRQGHRHRRGRMGNAEPNSGRRDPAELDGRRRHQGRVRPDHAAGGAQGGDGTGDRQRGAGAVGDFAPAVAAGADAVLAASVFHFRELTIGEVKAAMAAEGIVVR